MPQDLPNCETKEAVIQDVHAAVEKILLLDDLVALALIREILGQLSAIVADIAVLGKNPATKERAQEEFHDLMIEISVLSMHLKEAQNRDSALTGAVGAETTDMSGATSSLSKS